MRNQIEGIQITSKRFNNLQFVIVHTLDGFEIWRKKVGCYAKKIHCFKNESDAQKALCTLSK